MVQLLVNLTITNVPRCGFQFQYGAIIRTKEVHVWDILTSFNSSMVQLLVISMYVTLEDIKVSIPVWCNY